MNKALILKVLALCLVSALISGIIVYAQSPTGIMTLSGGNYPGSSSYTIFIDNGQIYGKDCFGVILSTDTDLGVVFNAVMAEAAVGDSIFIASGQYGYETGMVIDVANVTVYGSGFGTNLYQVAGSDLDIALDVQVSGVTLHDFWLDGNYNNNQYTNGVKLSSANADYFTMFNCRIWHFDGINLHLSTDNTVFWIHDNYIAESSGNPLGSPVVKFSGSADGKFINNDVGGAANTTNGLVFISTAAYCTFEGNKFYGTNEYYLYVSSPRNCVISNNIIGGGLPYGTGDAIYMVNYAASYGYGNIISGNCFYGSSVGRDGIRLKGSPMANNTVIGNYFCQCTNGVYEVDGTEDYNLIVGNVFDNCTTPLNLQGANTKALANNGCGVADYP